MDNLDKERILLMTKLTMMEHIEDTPRVLKKALTTQKEYGTEFINLLSENNFKKIYFLGSGTSGNAMMVIRNLFVNLLQIEGVALAPNLFTYSEPINPGNRYRHDEILVIGLSQNGDSYSTCNALQRAKNENYLTVAISEADNSPIKQLADYFVHLVCEKEQIGPETRGYNETIFQFYLLAIRIALNKHLISLEEYQNLLAAANQLIIDFPTVIQESLAWFKKNQAEFITMQQSAISGFGFNYPTAVEGSLKFLETFNRPCFAYEQEEELHGPIRSYNQSSFILMIIFGDGPQARRGREIAAYYRSAFTKHVFVISGDEFPANDRDLALRVATSELLSPILYIVPLQIFAAQLCVALKIDPGISPVKDYSISGHMQN